MPPTSNLSRMLPRAGLLATALVCLVVALYLLWSGVKSSQDQMRATRLAEKNRQNLVQLVSSIDLNHHRFIRASSHYVNGSGTVTRDETRWRLQHYASRFSELRPHLQKIDRDIANHKSTGDVESEEDTLLARNQRVSHTIKQLLRDGEPTLIYIDALIDWLTPGDVDGYNDIVKIMDLLGDDIVELELAAQRRQQLLDEQALANKAVLAGKLATARASMGLGLLMLFALVFFFIRHRHISARTLRRSNEELQRQIEASEKLTEELHYRATHDALSGLYNRSGFTSQMQELLSHKRGQHGLCFIDLDMFKIVNDTSGHGAGDQLIVEVAELIVAHSPGNAVVSRFGGDEFVLLVGDCERATFERSMKQCCDALRALSFRYDGRRFAISGSFGAVHFDAAEHDMDTLMGVVDSACYEAKNEGGGRIRFRSGVADAIELRRDDHVWVNRIQSALENDSFCLYYQPIASVNAASGEPAHSWELLLRMIDNDGTVIAPARFLDVAEQYSLAPRIDSWVINKAFDWLSGHGGRAPDIDCLNINLSGKSIGNQDLLDLIRRRAERFEGDLSVVCFEITETAIVGNNAREFLLDLKALGFRIALDDFGSGFSSFGYLESLPVDYIKIDGIFVKDIDTNTTHQEFVKAINAVGKAMSKLTVAEFVENQESLSILRELGVDFAQGYHLSRPLPLPDIVEQAVPFNKAA